MSARPYRATEILLQAEVELRPLLDGLEAGVRRAVIADLTSIAVRLDGVDGMAQAMMTLLSRAEAARKSGKVAAAGDRR
jgi:hypothetical protein